MSRAEEAKWQECGWCQKPFKARGGSKWCSMTCRMRKRRMGYAVITTRVPPDVREEIKAAATKEGVTMERWLLDLVKKGLDL